MDPAPFISSEPWPEPSFLPLPGVLAVVRCAVLLACCLCTVSHAAFAQEKVHKLRTFRKQQLYKQFFSEGASFGDFNKDGHMDIVGGPFWHEGPTFEKQHVYSPPKPFDPAVYSDNFFAFTHDFNGDGWTDILIYGFPGQDASWYENTQGKDGMWVRHKVMNVVDNESPTWGDLTGDGKPEIIAQTDGYFGYASPDWTHPEQPWTFHRISEPNVGGRFTHGLGYGDVNGDGRFDLLEKNGWWEQPASLEGDPVWKKHAVAFAGPGGAHMYAYDVDGDGLNDVITSLAAHGFGLVWYKQIKGDGEPKFEVQPITGTKAEESPYGVKFSQIHAIDLVDMNGDGLKDIITGKRYWAHGAKGDPEPDAPAVVYWFELSRGKDGTVDWIPHLIDDNSGVGVQVVAGDISGDGVPDVVVGNKQGLFVHTQIVKEVTKAEWELHQPRKKAPMAQGLSPEEAALAMTLPPGFHARLVAGEPDVVQPIAMAFDDRGRLWVAEAYSYPERVAEDKARDRILILEDTNGDAKFDKRTVFADKLNLVSGLELGFGGVYVGAAPYLLFIPDKNKDDRPDGAPEVLLDGWGQQDTHETLNSFIWGPDGWLYGCHGVFTFSNVGKPGASDSGRKKINAGIWRYHPTRHEFEVFAEGTSNPWGVDFNDHGHAFATACVIPHLYHVIQGGKYQRQAGQHYNPYAFDDIKTIAKHRHWVGNQWNQDDRDSSNAIGGGHAHAGAMIYLGGAWPERYRDQLFMNNIHGARLNQDKLTRAGSGYVGDAAPDFCFANDVWSQWIYLTYGPDGQAVMIDWYDKNQCHHKRDDGHDRTNGRIFKIVYGEHKAVSVDLAKWTDAELVDHQLVDNDWYVRHGRRLLQERAAAGTLKPETRKRLAERVLSEATTAKRLRSLWALHVTGPLDAGLVDTFLSHDDADVRAWTMQLVTETTNRQRGVSDTVAAAIAKLAAADASPTARLYASSAMQRLPMEQRWAIADGLVSHAEDADDHNLPLLTWYGIEPLVMLDPPRALQLAAKSKIPLLSRFIVRRLAAEDMGMEPLLAHLQKVDGSSLGWMLEEIVASLRVRANVKAPAAWTKTFDLLMKSPDISFRQQAEYIAVKFGDQRVFPQLRTTLANRELPAERRKLALDSLLAGKDPELPQLLQSIVKDKDDLRTAAINALASVEDAKTPEALLAVYAGLPLADQQATIATLTARPAYVLALLDAIEAKKVPRNDLSAFTVRQLARLDNAAVNKRLTEVWGAIRNTPADKLADMERYKKQLSSAVLSQADLPHGRELFTKTCASCHQLFGAGKQIGPDLTGSNRRNLDYLLDNMLDPSAVVGKDYQMTTVVTEDGRTINGIVKQETDSAVTLQTPTDLVTIPKADIEARKLADLSLMPEGQLKPLSANDVRDLVAYLQTGAQVPLPGEGPWIDPKTKRVAGAIEGESLKPAKLTGGNAGGQNMAAFSLGKWSGESHLWWTSAKPGDQMAIDINVKQAGRYEVYVAMTKAVDYGIVKVALDDLPPSEPLDMFNNGVVNTPPISLGEHNLAEGKHRLTFEIVGANPKAAKAYMVGLDYIVLSPR